jgi:hypothetical protein
MGVEHEETQPAAPVSVAVEAAPAPLIGAFQSGARMSAAQIVSLQRTAGNAAVSRMLARDPDPAAPAPAAGDGGVAQKLLSGAFDDTGDYKPDGTGFASGELDGLLKQTGSGWGGGIDTTAPPTGQSVDGSKPSGGDSAGKSVGEHPPWVAAFQNKLIGVLGQWSQDDKVAQRLMQVFLRAWTRAKQGGMAANVAVFYQYAGAHEENAASQGLGTAGAKGVEQSNWCQQASTYAICEALLRNGLRFKSPPGQEGKERLGTSRINEVGKQAGKYEAWLKGGGGSRTAWGGDKCWASAISPGDVFSFYSAAHGPTSTGHVVTAVTGANPGEETTLTVVSGNAGGEAVRVEEIQRVQPPPGLFSGSAKRPSGSKQVYIWSLQRASVLNAVIGIANSNQQFSDADIQAAGLERCKPLDEIWPASEAVASTGGGAAPASGGGAPAPASGGGGATPAPASGGAAPATEPAAPSGGGGATPAPASGGGPAPATEPAAPSGGGETPAPPQAPEPASGGGGAPAPQQPAPADDGGLGGLGEWFESLTELVFGETGGEEEQTASKNDQQGAASGGAGSGWFSS